MRRQLLWAGVLAAGLPSVAQPDETAPAGNLHGGPRHRRGRLCDLRAARIRRARRYGQLVWSAGLRARPADLRRGLRAAARAGGCVTLRGGLTWRGTRPAPVSPRPGPSRRPLEWFVAANPALDLTRLGAIEFVCDITASGHLIFDDIEVTARRFPRGDLDGDGEADFDHIDPFVSQIEAAIP